MVLSLLQLPSLHDMLYYYITEKNIFFVLDCTVILPHRQIKYPVDFDDELKTRKRQIR